MSSACALAACAPFTSPPGTGVLIVAAVVLVLADARLLARTMRMHVPRWMVPVTVVLAVVALVPSLVFTTGTPAGWDFPVHAWHAHALADHLRGSLRGWTWAQAMGWPEGDFYAAFLYVPAALLHVASFGAVSVEAATQLEAVTALLLWPVAFALLLGRRQPVPAVVAGGVMVAMDPGAFHQVGLIPFAVAGMWPARLAFALCVLLAVVFRRCVEDARARDWAWLAVLSVVASQCHVAAVTYVGFALLLACISADWRNVVPARVGAAVLTVLLGMATAAWLVLPFFAQRDLVTDISDGGQGLAPAFRQLVGMEVFPRVSMVEFMLGAGGAWWLWRRDAVAGRWVAASVVLGVLLLNKDVLASLLPVDPGTIGRFQWSRYLSVPRAGLVFCAGMAGAQLLAWGARKLAHATLPHAVVASLCTGLLVVGAARTVPEAWGASSLRRAMQTVPVQALPWWPGVLAAAERVKRDGGPDVLLAVDAPLEREPSGHVAGLVEMAVELPVLAVHRQGTFEFKEFGTNTGRYTAEELKGAGVTHLLSAATSSPVTADMTLLETFAGNVKLYALPRQSVDHRWSSQQGVNVEPLVGDTVTLTGPDTGWTATVRMRWTPRWHAQAATVQVERGPLFPGARPMFVRVTAPPGHARVMLEYGPPPAWIPGWSVSVVAMVFLVFLVMRLKRAG